MVNLDVVEQLLNHINRHTLCKTTDKILLAVSGGLDSMVMLHLFVEAGYRIAVAHCNFQLRGKQSDDDETFVADTCRQLKVPCFAQRFNTDQHASARGISIQMAARELRYAYFEELVKDHAFAYVATAHHFSDTIESVFLNLIRGTGLDGLRGIAVKKEKIIRPMLFASRQMIHDYAVKENIEWREDASNTSDDYQRNFLRHQVIPKLKEMNPAFEEGFRQTHERLLGGREFAQRYMDDIRSSAVISEDEKSMALDIKIIRQSPSPAVLLWELVKELGFNFDQCQKVTTDHQPGKIFLSGSHQLLVDRKQYIIDRRRANDIVSQTIETDQRIASNGSMVLVIRETSAEDFTLAKDPTIAQLDAGKLKFPLLWRKWQAGDYFIPLGMRSEKKVSDFLIDLKVPFNSKADITLIESAGEVVWIVGHRIHERYKVTSETSRILIIEPQMSTE